MGLLPPMPTLREGRVLVLPVMRPASPRKDCPRLEQLMVLRDRACAQPQVPTATMPNGEAHREADALQQEPARTVAIRSGVAKGVAAAAAIALSLLAWGDTPHPHSHTKQIPAPPMETAQTAPPTGAAVMAEWAAPELHMPMLVGVMDSMGAAAAAADHAFLARQELAATEATAS